MKGSQINGGNSDYGRVESDFYPTPPNVTQALLNYLRIPKGTHIWEPACGEGHMSSVLELNGYKVTSTDLNECCGRSGVDFLETNLADYSDCKWIITNPPFKISEGFIRKAWGFNMPFALLLKSQYWHSKKRSSLFNECRPSHILPLTWRPDFLFKTRGSGSPLMDVIWCVWEGHNKSETKYDLLMKPE